MEIRKKTEAKIPLQSTKILFLSICIGLFMLSFVSAISDVFVQTQDNAILIEYPKLFVLKQNEDFHLRFHAFNKTNGVLLTNETINCTFNLYDSFGEGVLRTADLDFNVDEGTQDCQNCFNYHIDKGNFSTVGSYSYMIRCENDAIGGAVSVGIEVTPSGSEKIGSGGGLSFIGSTLVMLIIAITFFLTAFNVKNIAAKVSFFSFSAINFIMVILFVVVSAQQNLYGYTGLVSGVETFWTVIQALIGLGILILLIITGLIIKKAFKIKRGYE